MPAKIFMNTNLDFRSSVKFNRGSNNQNVPSYSTKTSLKSPLNMSISGNMIGRVHYSKPGCGSCGK